MTPNDLLRQAQMLADDAALVLEQITQRLDQLETQLGGQAPDVVVALDGVGSAGKALAGLDDVRIESSLS